MRKFLTTVFLSAACACAPIARATDATSADLLFFNDPENGSSFVINDSVGNALATGCMAIGQLSTEVVSGSAAEIFAEFSRAENHADIAPGENGNFFSGTEFSAQTLVENGRFSGTLYFFIGNGANAASSTEFTLFVFQNPADESFYDYDTLAADMAAEFAFASDMVLADAEHDWMPRTAAGVFGAIREIDGGETLLINLISVPEPSAFALLAGLGALALAGTRCRRKISR
ncbi:MAG: PEP-CTERM sorting domain-containing protein [Candidatus Spyradosoma sp.]